MVQRRDLNKPPARQLADIVAGIREKQDQQRTGSHGVKDMGPGGDIVWSRPEAPEFEVSIRDIDGDLQDAQGRIDEAKADSEAALERAGEAEATAEAVQGGLDTLETVTLPGAVADLEAADQAAQADLATLDGKLIGLDGAVAGKPDFADLTVGNLTAGTVATPEAVIGKLWADGIMSKSVTSNSLTVSPGNLLPDPNGNTEIGRDAYANLGFTWSAEDTGWVKTTNLAGSNQTKPNAGDDYASYPLEGGRAYRLAFEAKVEGGTGGARYAIYCTHRDGSTSFMGDQIEGPGGDTENYTPVPADEWTQINRTWIAPDDVVSGGFALQVNSVTSGATRVLIRNPFAGVKANAVMIENGAITTPKLTVTEDMSAALVSAMSLESKKLVVTDEAILNHATLIGDTVVEDINVTGKLIGTDGVFTGTVDFENVNVTGLQLVEKLEANSISADKIQGGAFTGESFTGGVFTGGLFKTSDGLAGQVEFADNAYSPSWAPGFNYPGIRVEPTDASTTNIPPGIGSYGDGVIIDGGSDTSGRSSYAIMNPRASLLRTFRADGSTGGVVQTSPDGSLLRTYREDGSTGGVVQTSPGESRVQTYGAGGGYGWVQATGTSAEVAAVNSSSNYVARIRATENNIYITSRGGGQSAGGVIEAGTSGASVKRLNASNMAVCGMETENNQTRIYGSDGTYMRGQVAAGRDGIIAKSGHGMGLNILNDGATFTGSAGAGAFSGTIVRLETAPTTSAGASAVIATNPSGVLFRSTSSRRYKKNIVDWSPDAQRVLALQPRQWQHNDPSQPGNIDETWHVGFVAEEVDELGLKGLVKYDGDGKGGWRPDGLNYDRFAAAHQVVLQKHEQEIADLKAENAALVARLEAIEARLG